MKNAHQAVFSSLSGLLKKLFNIAHNKHQNETVRITLDTVDPLIVEKLIEYVYQGKTFVDHHQQHELKDLCELLDIELPLRYFETQSPCPIIGTIAYKGEQSGNKRKY